MPSYLRSFSAAVFLFGSFIASVNAGPISTIYAFGDSLSDAGNIHQLTGIPTAPYVNGEFSNGPVWVQDLSAGLGLGSLTNSLSGGHDFAYGDAQSGTTPVNPVGPTSFIDLTGPTGQLAQFHGLHPVADPNALYTIWIGSNDLSSILQNAAPSAYAADAGAVVANIDSAVNTLAGYGAKNVLVLTVPDLGKTPAAIASGPLAQAAASALSGAFDLTLVNGSAAAGFPSLTSLAAADGLNLSILDTYSLIDGIVANKSAFGFTNVTDPCVTGAVGYVGGTACSPNLAAQNQYLFWDDSHPTAAGQALVADAALLAIPEPASFALIGAGLFGLYLQRRKKA